MRIFPLLALLLSLLSFTHAQSSSLTKELYEASGLRTQVALLAPTFEYQIKQAKEQDAALKDLPDDFMRKILTLVHNAFDAKRLEGVLLHHIEQRMSQRNIKEVLSWYKTGLGQKCVRLENSASTVEGMAKLFPYMQQFQNNKISATRTKLLKEFASAIGFYEHTKELAIDASVTMIMAFTSSMPADQRPTLFQTRNQISSQLQQNRSQFEYDTYVTLAYTYEQLSDNEIRSYIKFAKSAAGKAFMQTSFEALSSAMSEGFKNL